MREQLEQQTLFLYHRVHSSATQSMPALFPHEAIAHCLYYNVFL